MSLYGNSRPASGCEHHMSHYWEMMFEQKGERPVPHGTQVGVGTVLVLKAVETFLAAGKPDFNAARTAAARYDAAVWQKEIAQAYGPAAPGVIEMEQTAKKNETSGRLARNRRHGATLGRDRSPAPWSALLRIRGIASAGAGSPATPAEIGVDKAMLRNTFLYCKEVRARYTILQLLWDLAVLEPVSQQVIDAL